MAEKIVKGRQHSKSEALKYENTESMSIRPLQFSVNGGLGAEFF